MKKISNLRILYEVFVNNILLIPLVRLIIFPIIFTAILSSYLEVRVSEVTQDLTKRITTNEATNDYIFRYFLFALAAATLTEFNGLFFTGVVQFIYRSTARSTFRDFISLSPRKFNCLGSGEIQTIIDRKSKATSELAEVFIINFIPLSFTLLFAFSSITSRLGNIPCIIILSSVCIYATITIIIAVWRTNIRRKLNKAENIASNKLQDSLINQETIVSYRTIDYEYDKYDHSLVDVESNANRLWRAMYVLNYLQKSIFLIQNSLIIYFGIYGFFSGHMNPADLVFFISISKTLTSSLGNLGYLYSRYTQAILNARATHEIVNQSEEKSDTVVLESMRRSLKFTNIHFEYDNKTIFEDVSFEILKGEKVAIVGKNGAGKSTLFKLLLKFENYGGDIDIDGINIKNIREIDYRNIIAYVPQNSFLFNISVKENIKYGSKNISDEMIYQLCKDFGVFDTFSQLEQGFDTCVGERGKLLSGGERQKILIMRAILKKKDILLMDEPTSALDKESEGKILSTIMGEEDATVLVILHNLELVSMFDKVIFIQNKMVEVITEKNQKEKTSLDFRCFLSSTRIKNE